MQKKNLIAAGMLLLSNVLFTFSFATPLAPAHEEPVPLRQTFIYQPEPACGPVLYLVNQAGYPITRVVVSQTDFNSGAVTTWSFDFTSTTQPTYPYLLPSPYGGYYSVNVFYQNSGNTGTIYVKDNYPDLDGDQVACRSLGAHNLPLNFTGQCQPFTVIITSEEGICQ
jgi:hypothetical protein